MSFNSFLYKLRKYKKARLPIKVRRIKSLFSGSTEWYGCSKEYSTHYLIQISDAFDLSVQKDTLLHEWAHCVVGWKNEENSHTKEWGQCYAELYREMIDD